MIKRKPKISSEGENASPVKLDNKNKKKIPPKKKVTKSPSVRKEYLDYITNPDTTINKQDIKEQIKSFDNKDLSFQAVLLSIDMTESYKQFGPKTMKEFIDNEFKVSYKTAHRILSQARIAFAAGGVDAVGKYSGNALEAMKGLETDEQKKVLAHAVKSTSENITRTVIAKAMEDLGLIEELGDQHKKTKKKVTQIHSMIKKSTTRPEFLQNMAVALIETLQAKDIRSIVKRLNTMKQKEKTAM